MKRRLVCALFIVAALPVLASIHPKDSSNPSPSATIALAGHSHQAPCACTDPACACPNDPMVVKDSAASPTQVGDSPDPAPVQSDLGLFALSLFVGFTILSRLVL